MSEVDNVGSSYHFDRKLLPMCGLKLFLMLLPDTLSFIILSDVSL